MIEIFSESAILHMLENVPDQVEHIWIPESNDSSRHNNLVTLAKAHGIAVEFRKRNKAEEPSVMARVALPEPYTLEQAFKTPSKIIVGLDHIQDPQNFGAICRTAEGLGVGAVIYPKDRSVTLGPGVYSASVGAVATIPLVPVANLRDAMKKAKAENYWVMGATKTENALPIEKAAEYEKIFLIMGSEWEGLSQHVQKDCDLLISIPMVGKVESLNVSAAAAILIHELMKNKKA